MNLKTILFRLGLRKLRNKDIVTVKEPDDEFQRHFLVIGKQFNIKKDRYNRQESKGRVAVEYREGFEVTKEMCELLKIDKNYIDKKRFKLLRTKYVVEVWRNRWRERQEI